MPISEAFRRCPDAVFLRPDMEKYRHSSQQVFQILETLAPVVEAASIDEAYLDVSGLEKLLGTPESIGHQAAYLHRDRTDRLGRYRTEPADCETRL